MKSAASGNWSNAAAKAESLREEAMALGPPSEDEADQAMTTVITAIRDLEASGQLKLADIAAAE